MKKFFFCYLPLFILSSCSYNVFQFQNTYKFSKSGTNFYLIKQGDSYLMIDSGTPNNGNKIEKTLLKHNIDPHQIKYLILTHAHYDHAGNAAYFKNKYGTRIIAGIGDQHMIQQKGQDEHLCATHFLYNLGKIFTKKIRYRSFTPDIWIHHHYDLQKIGFSGTIVPVSGHTEGSLIVMLPQQIFVGDLIRGSLFKASKPKRHFFMCDIEGNNKDIHNLLNQSESKNWFLGHGGPVQANNIKNFLKKNSK